ncbi:MAG: glycosyltransferase [Ignavibacteria bacterium]|nr:glycosyltransferase [Ignavibacteria bacterium]
MKLYDVVLIALADVRQDARTLNLARTLSKKFKVAVVSMDSAPEENNEPFEIHRVTIENGSVLSRALQLRAYINSGVDLSCKVVGAMDLFAGPASITLSKKHKANLVYDAREFYFALASLAKRPVKQFLVSTFEKFLMARTSAVTVSGHLDAGIIAERYGLQEQPAVILNTPPFATPVASSRIRDQFSIPPSTTICLYQGLVAHGRGIEPMMRALALLDNVALCVIGNGPHTEQFKLLATELNVTERVFWKGAIPYSQLHTWTCSADIGVCLIEPISLSYEYALPNKLFEFMMAGIPSLVTDLPALHQHIAEFPVGMLVGRELQPQEIADAVVSIRNPYTYAAMVEQCKHVEQFSYERQQSVAVDVYYHAML